MARDNLIDMKRRKRRITYEIGQRYHSFIIANIAPRIMSKNGRYYTAWECLCDCGKKFVTTTKQIQKGVRKSCGCLSKSNRFKKLDGKSVICQIKIGHYKNSAKRRDIRWDLTKNEFYKLIFSNCAYCGSEPSMVIKSRSHSEKVNGVDRIDSNGNYTLSNCVSCCKMCNYAKASSTLEDFLEWIKRLKSYENSNDIRYP